MITIALGIVLAGIILAVVPMLFMAIRDWRFWRCLIFGHQFERVEPFTHSTGVLSRRVSHRCRRCGAVPGIFEESKLGESS
jgi:hypothetical protein